MYIGSPWLVVGCSHAGPPEETPCLAVPVCWGKEQQELDNKDGLGILNTTTNNNKKSLHPHEKEP